MDHTRILVLMKHLFVVLNVIYQVNARNNHREDTNRIVNTTDVDKFYSNIIRRNIQAESAAESLESEEEIKQILEEKYKFRNDEKSTRFKISNHVKGFKGDSQKSSTEGQIEWAFRSYAVRRIVGGMDTSISIYPYNVAISRNGRHWCGGSIIDEQWVLSAGHCMESAYDGDKNKLFPFVVRAGSSNHNKGGYQARINKVFFPEDYSPGNADYDFSLLRLDRPLPIGRNIAVLNLPSRNFVVKTSDILVVTGWGSTDIRGFGHIPERLRFVPVPVLNTDRCQKSYSFYITPRMVCAGYATGGKDACNHDSGGPAVKDGVLIGVVSFGGKRCGDPNSPGVYSRVSEATEWVERTIENNEAFSDPELKPKIQKARLRERELHRFEARVETKKSKIKNWLRETLRSPSFIQLAKRKLKEAGFHFRRNMQDEEELSLDDNAMDELNLNNMITERILDRTDDDDEERALRILALYDIIEHEDSEPIARQFENESEKKADIGAIIAVIENH